jgi:hypothetical protein
MVTRKKIDLKHTVNIISNRLKVLMDKLFSKQK